MKLSNRRKVVLTITVIICIGFGLACTQNKVWVKPGTSQQALDMDRNACTQEVRQASYPIQPKFQIGMADTLREVKWNCSPPA
jgi:hypothetical protein